MAGSALDLARRQLVGLDVVVDRIVDRLMRRKRGPATQRAGEPRQSSLRRPSRNGSGMSRPVRRSVSGHYAGAVSRAAAAGLDGLLIGGLYTLGVAGFGFLLGDVHLDVGDRRPFHPARDRCVRDLGLPLRLRQPRHQRPDDREGTGRAACRTGRRRRTGGAHMFVRTLAFPLSVMFFGIGLLMIVVQREHRSLHDLIARSCVVYDWGDRSAEMPGPLSDFLNRAQPMSPSSAE